MSSTDDRCDKCGTAKAEWDTTPCVRSLTQSPRHTITRLHLTDASASVSTGGRGVAQRGPDEAETQKPQARTPGASAVYVHSPCRRRRISKAWAGRKLCRKVHGRVEGRLIVAARMCRPGSRPNRILYRTADLYWWHFRFMKWRRQG